MVKAAMVVGAMAEVLRGIGGGVADVEATAAGKAEAKAGMVLDKMEAAVRGRKAPAGAGWRRWWRRRRRRR